MVTDTDHSHMTDQQFTKSFAGMIGGFTVLTVALIFLGIIMAKPVQDKMKAERQANIDALVTTRVVPEGSLNVGAVPTPAPAAAAVEMSGADVYASACAACHAAGVAGAPKLGDASAWGDRIAQGMELLVEHAIQGYQGKAGYMPPKGGNAALTDDQVRDAVQHMTDALK